MFDRAPFWSAPPEWLGAVLAAPELRVDVVSTGAVWMISGHCAAVLAEQGIERVHGPRVVCQGGRYALRLAPDSVLFVSETPTDTAFGWREDGVALSDMSEGQMCFDVSGARAVDLLAMGAEYPFDAAPGSVLESARLQFAGLTVAVARRNDGWRLHVERAWAPALWCWLGLHMDELSGADS